MKYMNPYIGHDSQYYGIEEHRIIGGKGDGMRLLEVNNGKGMELVVSLDRAADISRLKFCGINMSYLSPCGYVAPAFYEGTETNWLKSFTAGFLTTCGLEAVGSPCIDQGEKLPLHGTIGNLPAEQAYWTEEAGYLVIKAVIKDEVIFRRKLRMYREIRVNLSENEFIITDSIENTDDKIQPLEILYHMNMGYPLLDEDSVVTIPSGKVIPRNEHAAKDLENWMKMEKPQAGYEERCYYHDFTNQSNGKIGMASIWQPKLGYGLKIEFDVRMLNCFVEWKMMGIRDYVLGLECGNCYPDGRDVMRQKGMLVFIEPGEKKVYQIKVSMWNKCGKN